MERATSMKLMWTCSKEMRTRNTHLSAYMSSICCCFYLFFARLNQLFCELWNWLHSLLFFVCASNNNNNKKLWKKEEPNTVWWSSFFFFFIRYPRMGIVNAKDNKFNDTFLCVCVFMEAQFSAQNPPLYPHETSASWWPYGIAWPSHKRLHAMIHCRMKCW